MIFCKLSIRLQKKEKEKNVKLLVEEEKLKEGHIILSISK